MMMERRVIVLFLYFVFVARVHAQDQSDFISIDCGMPDNSTYTDPTTGLIYVSDVNYIDTGVSKSLSPSYKTNDLSRQLANVRSFPEGLRNCYTLKPPKVKDKSRYFIRAGFLYGNYDSKDKTPSFDIYLGVEYWVTVYLTDAATAVSIEILYNPSSSSSYTHVCLVNTGAGTPFISVLELRLVNDNIYTTPTKSSLALYGHWDLRAYDDRSIIRYGNDIFDRVWGPSFLRYRKTEINTTGSIKQNTYMLPSIVMSNAITMQFTNESLDFFWESDNSKKYLLYMHFADFQYTQLRKFNINLNGAYWRGPITPVYLSTTTITSLSAEEPATWFNFSFIKTSDSYLPPMINAIEIYYLKDLSDQQTNQQDVDAIRSIKFAYGVVKNWQGDPCFPETWLGLICSNVPRISSLDLSFSGLIGTISPSIEKLDMLQSLNLSNNNLTGEVPKFLAGMQKLSVLNLSRNNFTGIIPSELIQKSIDGSLKLSFDGNPYLCASGPCNNINPPNPPATTLPPEVPKKKSSMLLPIIAAVAVVFVLLIALAVVWVCIIKRKNRQPKQVSSIATDVTSGTNMERDGPMLTQRQNYTYTEVIKMTRNFENKLGAGGFGAVFYGSIENIDVAVKMLSPSSAQGYKQFKAEAELLMRVHHRNLTTLVGYCDEGNKLGLIYEFMANGDLETHLSGKNLQCLSWVLRLEIALDAAQGLEYLHNGCRPPIIHRDIKTTNILLNEEMQAKLADFGLSKAFPADGGTHFSTAFAGTPGYFDPEFNMNETSDVYSFGVVLLELLTGKPPIAKVKERTHLSRWVGQTLETKGDVRNVVDRRLGDDFDVNSVWKLVDVAMDCVTKTSMERPTMNQVVIELKQCLAMENDRLEKDTRNVTNYEATKYSNVNVQMTGMSPMPR